MYEWNKKGINSVDDLNKKNSHNEKEENDVEIDTEIFDWNWLEDEDE